MSDEIGSISAAIRSILLGIPLIVLLSLCSFLPGFLCVRYLKLRTIEKLSISIGLSLFLIYLFAGVIYLTGADWRWCWGVTSAILILSARSWHEIWTFIHRKNIRRQIGAFGLLLLLGLLVMSLIRNYSGGNWAGDWYEHFQRTTFFLERLPYDTLFIRLYVMPARPPMSHLMSAYILAHFGSAGQTFEMFQIVSLFFNVLVFFPAVLLAGLLFKGGSRRIGLIMAFLATSPVFIHNSTWTWNKLISAFFVLLSIALYVRGWQKQSPQRIIFAAASMACAILVHYSAGPYAVFIFLHYLFILPLRKKKLLELFGASTTTTITLGTWFIWSIVIYGAGSTFGANTTVAGIQDAGKQGSVLGLIAANFYYTLVPHFLRMSPSTFEVTYQQPNPYGYIRDYFFEIFQPNLPFSLGLLGWLSCGYLVWRAFRASSARINLFWISLVCITTFLGVAVSGSAFRILDVSDGVAHVCLQPLTLMGLTLLAAGFMSLPRWLQIAMAFSIAATALVGVLVQVRAEMIFIPAFIVNNVRIFPFGDGLPSPQALSNSVNRDRIYTALLGDHWMTLRWFPLWAAILMLGGVIWFVAARASRDLRQSRLISIGTVIFFLVGSTICITDNLAGYRIDGPRQHDPGSERTLSIPEIERIIDPHVQAVRADRESSDAHLRLAIVLFECAELDAAWYEACSSFVLDPYNRKARYLARLLEGIYQKTAGDTRISIAYMQEHMETIRNQVAYGQLLMDRKFLTKARAVLADAIRKYPNDAPAHQTLALVLIQSGNLAEAIAEMETTVRLAPDIPDLADQLRALLARRGDTLQAIDQRIAELQKNW